MKCSDTDYTGSTREWWTLEVAANGSGGPWEWRTLEVADPGSGGFWEWGAPGGGGPWEWRAVAFKISCPTKTSSSLCTCSSSSPWDSLIAYLPSSIFLNLFR